MSIPKLKEFWIKNFKSYQDAKINFENFNLVVGKNGSGKTNLLDAFRLLKKLYLKEEYPFLEWWGYNNVVWQRDEHLPITIGMKLEYEGHDIVFETTFTGLGGRLEFLEETIDVKGIITFKREGEWLTIKHYEKFLSNVWDKFEKFCKKEFLRPFPREYYTEAYREKLYADKNKILKQSAKVCVGDSSLFSLYKSSVIYFEDDLTITLMRLGLEQRFHDFVILSPRIQVMHEIRASDGKLKKEFFRSSLATELLRSINNFMHKIMAFKPLNVQQIKENIVRPKKEWELAEDASNLHNVLHNLFLKEGGKLPERIEYVVDSIFPGTKISFDLTLDGRIFMRAYEKDLPLDPPMIPDGLYKVLTIMTAIESKPSVVLIDELENSLHPEAISRIVDELRNAECVVIATTHSPAVVDIASPNELIIVEKDEEGRSQLRRIKEPNKIKRKLEEIGVTLSEGWLYGKL